MKKLTAIVLTLIFILALTACGAPTGGGESVASGTISNIPNSNMDHTNTELSQSADFETMRGTVSRVGAEETYELTVEEIQQVVEIIENSNWNTKGTADCTNDCKLIINGETYYYHSDCGTWNDNWNNRYLTVTDTEKESINAVLSQYITLGF